VPRLRRSAARALPAALGAAVLVVPLALSAATPASSAGPPPSLLQTIQRVTTQDRYDHSTWGFLVRDRATDRVLFSRDGGSMFVTGSILKVFSTATALDSYGPNHRFRTPVYRTGAVRGGVLAGDLVLVASGDLSMGLREKPDGTMAYESAPQFDHTYANTGLTDSVPVDGDPLAGLRSLARQVARSGITTVRGDVIIDDRLFATFSGWPDAQPSPITPIWVNDNRIDITSRPSAVGQLARVQWRPRTAAYTVETRVRTAAAGQPTAIAVSRPRPGVFRVTGQIAADAGPTLRVGEIPNPASFARTAFVEALRLAGVRVQASSTGPNPAGKLPPRGYWGRRVAEHVSGRLAELTKVILKTSHNPGADLMACLNAVAARSRDCEAGLVAQADYVRRLGVPPDSVFLFDGAGSDERDRATGAAMTAFLRAVGRQPIGPAFEESLSILGVDGDIAQLGAGTPSAGKVRAKTGTRAGVTPAGQGLLTARTFVAYVDARSGRQLVISVMVRDVPFASAQEIFAVIEDNADIAVAMQQAY
jgi:D-alanyl-D-alanine carboxypeptidase/D-alanyl-D-alanine-endopeptidase (penicillin-binding protein 4)